MRLEFNDNGLYLLYLEKRETLPLYYCFNPLYVNFSKGGLYRCEKTNKGDMIVYDSVRGTIMNMVLFNSAFRKPSKLRLFLYRLIWWA